ELSAGPPLGIRHRDGARKAERRSRTQPAGRRPVRSKRILGLPIYLLLGRAPFRNFSFLRLRPHHHDARAAELGAFRARLAAVQRGDPRDDRESEPIPAGASAAAVVEPRERLEDLVPPVFGDARTVVLDGERVGAVALVENDPDALF